MFNSVQGDSYELGKPIIKRSAPSLRSFFNVAFQRFSTKTGEACSFGDNDAMFSLVQGNSYGLGKTHNYAFHPVSLRSFPNVAFQRFSTRTGEACSFGDNDLMFSSVQDGIYVLGKTHTRSTRSLKSFPTLPLKEFPVKIYLWLSVCALYLFTRRPGESYRSRLRSLLLCLCDVFRQLINSLVC